MVKQITIADLTSMKHSELSPFQNEYEYMIMYIDKLWSKSGDFKSQFNFDGEAAKAVAFELHRGNYLSYSDFCSKYDIVLTASDKKQLTNFVSDDGEDFRPQSVIQVLEYTPKPSWSVYIDDKSRSEKFKNKRDLTTNIDIRKNPVWTAINKNEYMFETLMGAFYIESNIKAKFKFRFDMLSYRLKLNLNSLNADFDDILQIKSATILPRMHEYFDSGFDFYVSTDWGRLVIKYYADIIDLISEFNGRIAIFPQDKLLPWATPRLMGILPATNIKFEFVHDYYQYLEKFATPDLFNKLFDDSVSNFDFNVAFLNDNNIRVAPEDFRSNLKSLVKNVKSNPKFLDILPINQQIQGPRHFVESRFRNSFGMMGFDLIGEPSMRGFEYYIDDGINESWLPPHSKIHQVVDDLHADNQDSLLIIPDLFIGFLAKAMILFETKTANVWVDSRGQFDVDLDYRPHFDDSNFSKVIAYFLKILFDSTFVALDSYSISQLENVFAVFELLQADSIQACRKLNSLYSSFNSEYMNYKTNFFLNASLDDI